MSPSTIDLSQMPPPTIDLSQMTPPSNNLPPPYIPKLEEKQEFRILNALVAQPDSSTEDAVQQILNLTSALIKDPTSLGKHLYDTAFCLLEIATRTPPVQQHKLVAFVHLLKKMTMTDPVTSEPLRHDGYLIWTELPTFGYTFADELGSIIPLASNITTDKRRRWENTTAFFAQLTASSDDTDFSRWALTAFCYAFGPWETPTSPTDIAVRAACIWYVYAADRLWTHVENDQDPEFERGDWDHWKQCLMDSQSTITDVGTRKVIGDALAQIKRVEAKD